VAVVVALAILVRASFDSDDPTLRAQQAARRSAGSGVEAPERAVAAAASESARNAPAAAPVAGAPNRGGSGSAAAPAEPGSSATEPDHGAAVSQAPAPASPESAPAAAAPAAAAASTPRARASHPASSASKETPHAGATATGAQGASGSATKAAGKDGVNGAGGAPGSKKPDSKLALAGDLAKKDGAWQRPPFGEDANSRLVAHFTQAGGAVLKGRVIDADSGKPSAGVTIETHVGDVFMRAVTDPAGNFRMTNIYTNRRLTVWLIGHSDAFVAERLELTSPGDGDTLDAGVVRLLRGDELASHLEGWMGMFVSRRGRRNVVAAVSPWSPADRAGIQVGDVLLSIEGRDVGGLGPRAASFLLRGPVGSKSNVALQNHDGTVVRYQLERVLR
jgi:hypothetical protein